MQCSKIRTKTPRRFVELSSRQTLVPWVAKNPEIEPTRQLPLEYISPSICLFGIPLSKPSLRKPNLTIPTTPLCCGNNPPATTSHRHTAFSIQSPSSCTAREACCVHSISKPCNVHDLFCSAPSTLQLSVTPASKFPGVHWLEVSLSAAISFQGTDLPSHQRPFSCMRLAEISACSLCPSHRDRCGRARPEPLNLCVPGHGNY